MLALCTPLQGDWWQKVLTKALFYYYLCIYLFIYLFLFCYRSSESWMCVCRRRVSLPAWLPAFSCSLCSWKARHTCMLLGLQHLWTPLRRVHQPVSRGNVSHPATSRRLVVVASCGSLALPCYVLYCSRK